MLLKRLTCAACKLQLGGYDDNTGTIVLDIQTYPAIAFYIDARASLNAAANSGRDPGDAKRTEIRYNVNIFCPSCGHKTSFEAVEMRFGTKKDTPTRLPRTDRETGKG